MNLSSVQWQSSKIEVDRNVFEQLLKEAEKGQLSNSAVASFEMNRKVLADSLILVKHDKALLQNKVQARNKFIMVLSVLLGFAVLAILYFNTLLFRRR